MRDLKGWLLEFYQGSRASWVRLIFVMNMSNCNYIEKKKSDINTEVLCQLDSFILYPSVIRIGNVLILLTGVK